VLKEKPTYLEDRCLAHGGESTSTQVPYLRPTALTRTLQVHPSPSPTSLDQYHIQQQHQQSRSSLYGTHTYLDGTSPGLTANVTNMA
jgi:hypothetical protein